MKRPNQHIRITRGLLLLLLLAVGLRAGAGRVFLTTFRFEEYGRDPYSTRLLDAIIRHAGGQAFAPKLEMK